MPTEPSIFSPAWLAALESALLAGQKAILARNLAGLEAATREQVRLVTMARVAGNSDWGKKIRSLAPRPAVERVLHLGRVQAALLGRAQRSLAELRNRKAGLSASYGPSTVARVWPDSKTGGEIGLCQV